MCGFLRSETTSGVEIYGNSQLSLDTPLCGSHFCHDMSKQSGWRVYPPTSVLEPFSPGTLCYPAGTICNEFMESVKGFDLTQLRDVIFYFA